MKELTLGQQNEARCELVSEVSHSVCVSLRQIS